MFFAQLWMLQVIVLFWFHISKVQHFVKDAHFMLRVRRGLCMVQF